MPLLDTATTISPLLGLLGTITGMIGTFNAIAAAHGQGNTDAILAGVGEALYATATGLMIAVICFIAYNYFTARLHVIVSETEQGATKLMNMLTETDPNDQNATAREELTMRFKQRRQLKRTRIEIIPMIDTMFFLLVFFMLSSLALVRQNSIHVNLPKASNGEEAKRRRSHGDHR